MNYLNFAIRSENIDTESRVVKAILSTDAPIRVRHPELGVITERLEHSKLAVDMSAAVNGLPLLGGHKDHSVDNLVGRARNVHLSEDAGVQCLRAELHFMEGPTWDKVQAGFITDVSLGYASRNHVEVDGVHVSGKWTPREVSCVAVPADHRAQIGRQLEDEDDTMTPEQRKAEREKGRKAELARQQSITQICELAGRAGDAAGFISNVDATPDFVREELHKKIKAGEKMTPTDTGDKGISIRAGDDQVDKFKEGASDALAYRSGMYNVGSEEHTELAKRMQGNQFRSFSVVDMARASLHMTGVDAGLMSNEQVMDAAMDVSLLAGRAIDQAIPATGLTTAFAELLADQANKALLTGWLEHEETWQRWCQTGTASDFKAGSRVHVSNFSNLDVVAENNDYQEGRVDDFAEPFQIRTFGKLWSISRQALVNDDLTGLGPVPQAMGRAAQRAIGDEVYGILTANGAMSDSNNLFDNVNHANDGGTGGITEANLDAVRIAMGMQTDNNGEDPQRLGIRPKYLLVPFALESGAHVQVGSEFDTGGSGFAINPTRRTMQDLEIVADYRLQENSAAIWYAAAARDTVEVVFLNGQQSPMLESENNWKRDGLHYKVRIDFDVLAVDWRGLHRRGV